MFDTPLPTNIQANDPDLPGILNNISQRLNTTRAEADLIPRHDMLSLVDTDVWDLSYQWSTAEVIKLGPMIGYSFQLRTSENDLPPTASKPILHGLPNGFRPAVSGAIGMLLSLSPVRDSPTSLIVENQSGTLRTRSIRDDLKEFGLAAGTAYHGTMLTWTHRVGTADDIPGTPIES